MTWRPSTMICRVTSGSSSDAQAMGRAHSRDGRRESPRAAHEADARAADALAVVAAVDHQQPDPGLAVHGMALDQSPGVCTLVHTTRHRSRTPSRHSGRPRAACVRRGRAGPRAPRCLRPPPGRLRPGRPGCARGRIRLRAAAQNSSSSASLAAARTGRSSLSARTEVRPSSSAGSTTMASRMALPLSPPTITAAASGRRSGKRRRAGRPRRP